MNKYKLETKVDFSCNLGRESNQEVFTLEKLGFTQVELETKSEEEININIQEMFYDWQANYLDSGWEVVEDE